MLPLAGLLVVAFIATWAVTSVRAKQAAAASTSRQVQPARETAGPSPFDDMPGSSDDPFSGATQAPIGDEVWTTAEELAETAEVLYQAAVAAKLAGDRKLMVEKGRDSVKRFQTALTNSEPVEADLVARYGDHNAQARHVVRARKLWFERVLWLHKSAMH